jgi:hypothetical protein
VAKVVRDAGSPSHGPADWRALRVVALWWWMLPAARISRMIGASVSFAAIVGGAMLIVIATKMANDEEPNGSALRASQMGVTD